MKAISLLQPWAALMTSGPKRVENRTWPTKFRGKILIHASQGWDKDTFPISKYTNSFLLPRRVRQLPFPADMSLKVDDYPRGGIVGIFEIYDCVDQSDDDWFFGPWGFLTRNNKPLPFHPCRGKLGIWDAPPYVVTELNKYLRNMQGTDLESL